MAGRFPKDWKAQGTSTLLTKLPLRGFYRYKTYTRHPSCGCSPERLKDNSSIEWMPQNLIRNEHIYKGYANSGISFLGEALYFSLLEKGSSLTADVGAAARRQRRGCSGRRRSARPSATHDPVVNTPPHTGVDGEASEFNNI